MKRSRLCFVVESGTDVRLVEGLAARFDLTLLAREIEGGVAVSHPPSGEARVLVQSGSRVGFAAAVLRHLATRRPRYDAVLVQGYGMAALAANVTTRRHRIDCFMLVCSPLEAYYRCRRLDRGGGRRFHRSALITLGALARVNARIGRHYIVLSEHLKQVVQGHGTRRPVHVIPVYGVDLERFTPSATAKPELRRRHGLPPTGALVFFSSRVAPEKDARTLLEAVHRLVAAGRDLRVLHRSGGFRRFRDLADRLGIGELVIATDAVHPRDLPLDYQASDLCVQASREEGLGFSPLEAMACGIPVIAAAVGGLRETVRDGETGWTYPPGDAAELARRIAAVLDDPAEGRRRAAQGRRMVAERYERTLVFDRLAALVDRRHTAAGDRAAPAFA